MTFFSHWCSDAQGGHRLRLSAEHAVACFQLGKGDPRDGGRVAVCVLNPTPALLGDYRFPRIGYNHHVDELVTYCHALLETVPIWWYAAEERGYEFAGLRFPFDVETLTEAQAVAGSWLGQTSSVSLVTIDYQSVLTLHGLHAREWALHTLSEWRQLRAARARFVERIKSATTRADLDSIAFPEPA
jgi:hypothetical protein